MTERQLPYLLLVIIPLIFVTLWFGISLLLGAISGWGHLQQRYPDRIEEPIERLRMQSAGIGRGLNVNFNNCLRLDLCPGGLRVGIPKLFGPTLKPFFVPWSEIAVEERSFLSIRSFRLTLGNGEGAMTVRPKTWQRITAVRSLRG
jgi:hypothetical protein